MRVSSWWVALVVGLGGATAGCGGGGGGDGVAPLIAGTGQQPPPGGPPPPPPPGGLDAALRAALAQDGIATPALRAAESDALVTLGQALFFDKLLSGNRNISCATCHHPGTATGDALPLSLGEGASGAGAARRASEASQVIARNAPSLFHVAARAADVMFWDGRVARDEATGVLTTPEPALNGPSPQRPDMTAQLTTALAAQALFPVTSPEEMRGSPGENELAALTDNQAIWAGLMARLVGTNDGTTGGIEEYRQLFSAAFPGIGTYDELTFAHAARAIAAFEMAAFATFETPLDRYLAGNDAALTAAQKRGGLVFTGAGRCAQCHDGPLLSDLAFHSIAAPQLGPGKANGDDLGRALISGDGRDDYEFRTPPLRNAALTGPWTHAGAFTSLANVVRHYRDPGDSLLGYDAGQLPAEFQGLVDGNVTRNQARLASIDGRIGNGIPLSPAQVADLLAFLDALTDPRAAQLTAPGSVPSGLPVDD